MTNQTEHDDGVGHPPKPALIRDADGHAAILLIESLIHGLVARSLISGEDAVEIIGTASEVNDELAQETDLPAITAQQAHTLLSDIAASLSIELPDRADRPR